MLLAQNEPNPPKETPFKDRPMTSILTRSYLFFSGSLLLLIGAYIALTPNEYLASLTLATQTADSVQDPQNRPINLLSDLRGMGGMLALAGLYLFTAGFRASWTSTAVPLATGIMAAFVLFRALGFVLDGLPQTDILIAFGIEALATGAGWVLLWSGRRKSTPAVRVA